MPGPRTSILFSLATGLMIAATQAPPAEATPTWLAMMRLPVHGNGVEFGGTVSSLSVDAPAELPAEEETPKRPLSKEELCETLVSSARERALPVSFFTNLLWQESRFNARAVSHAGAEGIAQFMPAVSKEVGLDDPFDPREAIPAAARLLRGLINKFGNPGLAAAAYNAGPGRVQQWMAKKGRLPAETRHYVATITGRPADTWRGRKTESEAFAVPPAVPCHSVEIFAAANRTEQSLAAASAPPKRKTRVAHAAALHSRRVAAARARPAVNKRAATRTAALSPREKSQKKG